MSDESRVDRRIVEHYQQNYDEGERLRRGFGWIEFERTRELVRRHLPDGRLRVLDIGGAAGIHAEWLAADGHNVHLIDPMPHHIDQARAVAARLDNPFTCALGDARALGEPDASVDAVLLFGPLYHLVERAGRLQALSEARRVLRPGGLCFVAAVSRFASLFDGLARGMLLDPDFREIALRDLLDGQHRNPENRPGWFTTAFFHHPDELEAEAGDAGFIVDALYGIEGMPAARPERASAAGCSCPWWGGRDGPVVGVELVSIRRRSRS
jgi:SAM-dependent methyltransferase